MSKYLISVIIPAYNAEKYIEETLDSVLSQTYQNWECIVVDDGSTDNSAELILSYCKIDSRFRYYKQKNAGPSKARNLGLENASGVFIQYLDADDVLLPQRFQIMLEKYVHTQEKKILYSDLLIGESCDIFSTSKFKTKTTLGHEVDFKSMYLNFGNKLSFIPGCILFHRDALLNVKWNESLSNSEDWDYYLQITKQGFSFVNIPEPLFVYRNTENSLSKNSNKTFRANYFIIWKWCDSKSFFEFSVRNALILKRSVMQYLLGRNSQIIFPSIHLKVKKGKEVIQNFFVVLSLIIALLFVLGVFVNIFLKRFFKLIHKIDYSCFLIPFNFFFSLLL